MGSAVSPGAFIDPTRVPAKRRFFGSCRRNRLPKALTRQRYFYNIGYMEISTAIGAFGALAQESRLKIFRLLVQCGPDGMAAGDIARRLKLPQNTLSFHIAALARAHLVASRKEGRSIIYFVDLEGTRGLLSFLVEDCCGGKAELCGCLIATAEAGCCPA